jgi:hypothetical protein
VVVKSENLGNNPLVITAMGFMPSIGSQKTGHYNQFSLLLGYTDLDELDKRFDQNWRSPAVEVFSESQLEIAGVVGGEWIVFEFSEPFNYDGSSNLLYELSWNGPINPPDSRVYTMNWEDEVNSVLLAMSPDSTAGYLTKITPNLVFLTSESLENLTFAGIKSSF